MKDFVPCRHLRCQSSGCGPIPFPERQADHCLTRVTAACGLASRIAALLLVLLGAGSILPGQDRARAQELYGSAVALLESGDYAGADEKIGSLLADFPEIPQALNVAGIIADLRGQPERSIAYFERAVVLRDDFIDARSNLARLYAKTGRLQEARRQFERVLDWNPAHLPSLKGLVELLNETGDYEAGLKNAVRALAQAPGDPELLLVLAKAQFKLGREAEAAATTRRLRRLLAFDGEGLHALGLMLLENGRYADAVTILREAGERQGRDPEIVSSMGIGYGLARKVNQAISSFQESIRLRPREPQGYFHLALAYGMQGRFDEAAAELRRVLRLDPESTDAAHHLGVSLYKQGLEAEAKPFFTQVRQREPDRVETLYYLALIRFQEGDYPKSLGLLSRVLTLQEDHISAHYKAAQVNAKLGRRTEAQGLLREFKRLELQRERSRKERFHIYAGVGDDFSVFGTK
ncbi:MAG: tetratricopeptide repeat protein [Acidobacteriota bacterium]|nr:tetratricopeptide repeat protein [Acidobacteriota bacterium]